MGFGHISGPTSPCTGTYDVESVPPMPVGLPCLEIGHLKKTLKAAYSRAHGIFLASTLSNIPNYVLFNTHKMQRLHSKYKEYTYMFAFGTNQLRHKPPISVLQDRVHNHLEKNDDWNRARADYKGPSETPPRPGSESGSDSYRPAAGMSPERKEKKQQQQPKSVKNSDFEFTIDPTGSFLDSGFSPEEAARQKAEMMKIVKEQPLGLKSTPTPPPPAPGWFS